MLLPGKSNLSNRKHEEELISVKRVIFVGLLCQSMLFLPSVVTLLLVVVGVADVVVMLGGGGCGGGGIAKLVPLFVTDVKTVVIIVVVLVKVTFCPAWKVMKI